MAHRQIDPATQPIPFQHFGVVQIGRQDLNKTGPTWDELILINQDHQGTAIVVQNMADEPDIQRFAVTCDWIGLN